MGCIEGIMINESISRKWRWLSGKTTIVGAFFSDKKSESASGCRGRSRDRSICGRVFLRSLEKALIFTFIKLVVVVHHEVLTRNACLSKAIFDQFKFQPYKHPSIYQQASMTTYRLRMLALVFCKGVEGLESAADSAFTL
jgi:hypothetical protein